MIAGSSGQRYIDNIFVNPDNDYEMIALNWTGYGGRSMVSHSHTHTRLGS